MNSNLTKIWNHIEWCCFNTPAFLQYWKYEKGKLSFSISRIDRMGFRMNFEVENKEVKNIYFDNLKEQMNYHLRIDQIYLDLNHDDRMRNLMVRMIKLFFVRVIIFLKKNFRIKKLNN